MSGIALLLVEDEEAHAELVARAFERVEGARVTRAEKLAQARGLLAEPERHFDLVLTDLRLPDGEGTELIGPDPEGGAPPVIVMTSQGDETAAVAAMKAGALDYVVKSETSFAEMPRISERALREWRLLEEQRRLRRALDEHQRLVAVGTAAAMLAHEIGNPLNSMALHAELLSRRLNKLAIDDEQVVKQIDHCTFEIRRLAELLQSFRALSREQVIEPVGVDLEDYLREIVERYEPSVRDRDISIELQLAGDLGEIEVDPDKLTQVLLNLLKNAGEAMTGGGTIELSASISGELAEIAVADTGPGVPDDVDIFEPFRSTKAEGSGLGLPIVQRIVAAHGGTITHRGNAPTGARFEIVLPRRSPEVA